MGKNKSIDLTHKYLARLHGGARASTQKNARELRRRQTEVEAKLWAALRNRQLKGKKFRRQQAIADYVVDFYCSECKLAVELDGNFHNSAQAKDYDHSRTLLLNEIGVTVLRFWNAEVLTKMPNVLERISRHLH